jgi:hypothetical protein
MNPKADHLAHRPLRLTTPLTDGVDVSALQGAIKAGFTHYKIDWLPLHVDGDFGPQTLHAARFYSWVLGLGNGHRKVIKNGTVSEATQHLLRNPAERSRADRRRAKRRQKRLAEIRRKQSEGPAFAVVGARACIGITESPAGSNSGPDRTIVVQGKKFTVGVSAFERYWGLGPCYWCLCFACFWVKEAGGKISGNCTYSVAIEGYARNHENGWIQVPIGERRKGDVTLWKFDGPSSPSDHGELVGDQHEDIGGNTSSDSGGSQSNGGGVFSKDVPGPARSEAQLSMVARPLYS